MKIIVDIDEKDYNFIKSVKSIMRGSDTFQRISADLFRAVKDGEPLPNNHGDLIDRDVAYEEYDKACLSWEGGLLKYVPTVIPAERGNNNGVDN